MYMNPIFIHGMCASKYCSTLIRGCWIRHSNSQLSNLHFTHAQKFCASRRFLFSSLQTGRQVFANRLRDIAHSFEKDEPRYDYFKRRSCGSESLIHCLWFGLCSVVLVYGIADEDWLSTWCGRVRSCCSVRAATKSDNSLNGESGTPRQRFNFIADVVDKAAAAVVYIEIKDVHGSRMFGGSRTASNGSGFIVDSDGLILTNAHVVANAPRRSVYVRLHDGRTFLATVEMFDAKSDLATLRIPCGNLPQLAMGESSTLRPGEWVIALGSPLSLSNTVTAGVVSTVNRQSAELGLHGKGMQYIQTDAAITFGNSGGPLVNLDGEVVGINAMKVTPGISFAIPIDYAKAFLKKAPEWRKTRKVPKASAGGWYLGITMLTLDPIIIQEMSLRHPDFPADITHGVLVYKLGVNSPAHRAGVKLGDIVTHINQQPVKTASDVYDMVDSPEPLTLTVRRSTRTLTLQAHPEPIL